jgi:uncharacterized membrane protein YgdD (TMEM256/DUF423 family)
MSAVIAIFGLFMLGISMAILVAPERLKRMLRVFLDKQGLSLAVGIRIVVGILFLLAASETRAPSFITAMGILFLLTGVAIPFIGRARIDRLVNWWLQRPDWVLRTWAVAAGALGGVFVWCGL